MKFEIEMEFLRACQSGKMRQVKQHLSMLKYNISKDNSNREFVIKEFAKPEGQNATLEMFFRQSNNLLENGFVLACANNRLNAVEFLIWRGAKNLDHGILIAVSFGYLDVVKLLFSAGVKIKEEFLNIACKHKHFDIAKFIYMNGRTVNWGQEAIMILSQTTNETEECNVIMDIILYNQNPSYKTCYLHHALSNTCRFDNVTIAKTLVNYGATGYVNAIYFACFYHSLRVLQFLLSECRIKFFQDTFFLDSLRKSINNPKYDILEIAKSSLTCHSYLLVCDNQHMMCHVLEKGVSIDKFSSSTTKTNMMAIVQTFQNAILQQTHVGTTFLPKELWSLVSNYSLY